MATPKLDQAYRILDRVEDKLTAINCEIGRLVDLVEEMERSTQAKKEKK